MTPAGCIQGKRPAPARADAGPQTSDEDLRGGLIRRRAGLDELVPFTDGDLAGELLDKVTAFSRCEAVAILDGTMARAVADTLAVTVRLARVTDGVRADDSASREQRGCGGCGCNERYQFRSHVFLLDCVAGFSDYAPDAHHQRRTRRHIGVTTEAADGQAGDTSIGWCNGEVGVFPTCSRAMSKLILATRVPHPILV